MKKTNRDLRERSVGWIFREGPREEVIFKLKTMERAKGKTSQAERRARREGLR